MEKWIEERSKENMIRFYEAELRKIHETHSAQHLNPNELQRFLAEGWAVYRRGRRYPYIYRLSDEAMEILKLE